MTYHQIWIRKKSEHYDINEKSFLILKSAEEVRTFFDEYRAHMTQTLGDTDLLGDDEENLSSGEVKRCVMACLIGLLIFCSPPLPLQLSPDVMIPCPHVS